MNLYKEIESNEKLKICEMDIEKKAGDVSGGQHEQLDTYVEEVLNRGRSLLLII